MRRAALVLVIIFGFGGFSEAAPKDPQQVEFEKKFEREAALVRTCPGDPRFASGPTAAAQRVYRYEKELWFIDVTGPRRLEAAPEAACDALTVPGGQTTPSITLPGGISLPGGKPPNKKSGRQEIDRPVGCPAVSSINP